MAGNPDLDVKIGRGGGGGGALSLKRNSWAPRQPGGPWFGSTNATVRRTVACQILSTQQPT